MNKKLIAAAIAAAVAAPAISVAAPTVYGKVHVSVQSNSYDDPTVEDHISVNSNASRLGVKGSEDLGGGLKAVYGLEMGYDVTDGGKGASIPVNVNITPAPTSVSASAQNKTPISARNAYVGLSGGFGTVVVGRHDTPAKMALYSTGIEVIKDAVGQIINKDYGLTERRVDNAIAYISPKFSGITLMAAVVPGEGSTSGAVNKATGLADATSLGLKYATGGLKVSLGYEAISKEFIFNGNPISATQDDNTTVQAAASYTMGNFMVGGVYEDTTAEGGNKNQDFTTVGAMVKASFGVNFLTVNYTNKDYDQSTYTDSTNYGFQLGHNFSKRSQIYAAYENHDLDAANSD